MSSMETAAAFPLRAPPKLVTRITIVHLIEMIFAGILMVFVVLPAIFKFSLVNASFWQIYGRFYVTGLSVTFFYLLGGNLSGCIPVRADTAPGTPAVVPLTAIERDVAFHPADGVPSYPPATSE